MKPESKKEQRSRARAARQRTERARKFVEKCQLKLVDGLPRDRKEFMEFWKSHPGSRGRGISSFSRHVMTNYDDICASFNARFGTGIRSDMKIVLQDKAWAVVRPYLEEIGFFDQPRLKKRTAIAASVPRKRVQS